MKGNTGTTPVNICCTAVVFLMAWVFITSIMQAYQSNNCGNYMELTGIKTTMLKGKCYKYVDGQLQIVKELE